VLTKAKSKKVSKFILTLDASQIQAFMTCPLQWYYKYKQNLILNTEHKPAPDKGHLVHSLLAFYYSLCAITPNENKLTQAQNAINLFKESKETLKLFPNDINFELEDFICQRFLLYVQKYLNDDFASFAGGVEVGFSYLLYEDTKVKFILEGRIDLITKLQNNILCFVDHKTQSRDSSLYHYTPQFKTYALVTGYEYGIINYFGMQEDKTNNLLKANKLFRRDLIHFNKNLIEEWRIKLIQVFYQVRNVIGDNKTSEASILYLRNDSACAGAFNSNPCSFIDLCEEPNFEIKQRIKEFKFTKGEKWTPW